MNHVRNTTVRFGTGWVEGDVASADYFAHARREAAQRTLGGPLLRKLGDACTHLLRRVLRRMK
jgi:hypothetical protein